MSDTTDTSTPAGFQTDASETRFAFGKNWKKFLSLLNPARIELACESLKKLFNVDDFSGKSFLDAGSGSGLFSLAATKIGATKVHSFDFDLDSVACAEELKRRYPPENCEWTIERGDCLGEEYLETLPQFDVVYSWGVLHHTGQMWNAIDLVSRRVKPGGLFLIGLYNDQGWKSRAWTAIKRFYCQGIVQQAIVVSLFVPFFVVGGFLNDLRRGRNPITRYRTSDVRGMSVVRDWFDWLGGYPFEVATPKAAIEFCEQRGFALIKQTDVGKRMGVNEFLFQRQAE